MDKEFVEIGGVNVAYRFFGTKSKSNILILHGWGGSSDSWLEVSKKLSENGYSVCALDLPGFGDTLLEKEFELDDYAQLIEKFVKKMKFKNLILLGHSNGGKISIRLSVRGILNINKLILNNSAGIRPKLSLFKKCIRLLAKLKPVFKIIPFYNSIRKLLYKAIGGHDYINCENEFQTKTFQNLLETDLRDEMGQVRCETVMIWGENDTYTPLSHGKQINELIPESKLIILDGERHGIHLQNPDRLTKVIIENLG